MAEIPGLIPDVRSPGLGDGDVPQEGGIKGTCRHVHPTEIRGEREAPTVRAQSALHSLAGLQSCRPGPACLPARRAFQAPGIVGSGGMPAMLAPNRPEVPLCVRAEAAKRRVLAASAAVEGENTGLLVLNRLDPVPKQWQRRLPAARHRCVACAAVPDRQDAFPLAVIPHGRPRGGRGGPPAVGPRPPARRGLQNVSLQVMGAVAPGLRRSQAMCTRGPCGGKPGSATGTSQLGSPGTQHVQVVRH